MNLENIDFCSNRDFSELHPEVLEWGDKKTKSSTKRCFSKSLKFLVL